MSVQVSIGVPVYNEERHLELALASLRAQDHGNLEIIVSDNGSSDRTPEICRQAARADARICFLQAPRNQGSVANFQRCLDAAQGEFFMWAGGHDLWSSNFVSGCLAALARNPGSVIAVPGSAWIDPAGQDLERAAGILDTRGLEPLARVFMVLWANMHAVYGLMPTSQLRAAGPIPNYAGADLVLLMKLALIGEFAPAPEAIWSRRETRGGEDFQQRQQRYRSDHFALRSRGLGAFMPLVQLPWEILSLMWSSKLSLSDKLAFSLALPAQLPARYLVGRRRIS